MDEYVGIIKAFAGSFTPRYYVPCNGQLMNIQDNQVLFAILGTTYGGDGQRTFGIPDLRGRSAIGTGQGVNLPTNHLLGEMIGTETTQIMIPNMPAHTHAAVTTVTMNVSGQPSDIMQPGAQNAIGVSVDASGDKAYGFVAATPDVPIAGASVSVANAVVGGNAPISIQQPTLAITYIMCSNGIFPSRN